MSTLSDNMNLIIPTVGEEIGPDWATELNADLGILDQHNHSSGQGVPISPSGMNINSDLPINIHNLTLVKTVRFSAQTAFIPGTSPNLGAIYVAGNELYYNDEAGNVVQITNVGSVNAGAGSITGLPSGTASATYSAGSQKFIWQSATSTAAAMDGGPVTIREIAASAKGVTLQSVTSLAADYTLVLPTIPAVQNFVSLDASGNLGASWNVDNSTIEISSNNLRVKDLGITTAKINTAAVTHVKLGALGQQLSSSSGANTISSGGLITLTATLTTSGRPVFIAIQPDGNLVSNPALIQINASGGSNTARFTVDRGGGNLYFADMVAVSGVTQGFTVPGFLTLDPAAAGTYTYTLNIDLVGAGTLIVNYIKLIVFEVG